MVDFDLSKPQKLLQSTVREFLSRECPPERVRKLIETPTAFDADLWQKLSEQGWIGLTIPEKWEGIGLNTVDLAAVCEMMGEYCLPGPFISNQWASGIISNSGNDAKSSEYLSAITNGEAIGTVAFLEESAHWDPAKVRATATAQDAGYRLDGKKLFIPDMETAHFVLWVARLAGEPAIFMVDRTTDGMTVTPMPAIDQTRKLYRVDLDGTVISRDRLLVSGEAATEALRLSTNEATVAVCAELVGCMQWMMRNSVEYAKSREQFGRTIGSFQAVQHLCANMVVYLESARSATYYAAWAVSNKEPDAGELVSIAKAYCSDAGREMSQLALQVHGGIGFTWDHDLQLYTKRAKSSEILFGDATYHRERIACIILDQKKAV